MHFPLLVLSNITLGCSQRDTTSFTALPEAHQGDYDGPLLPFPAQLSKLPTLSGELSESLGFTAAEVYRWGYLTRDGKMIVEPGEYSLLDPAHTGGRAVFRITSRDEEEDRVRVGDVFGIVDLRTGTACEDRFPYIAPMSGGFARARRPGASFGTVDAVFLGEGCTVLTEVDSQEKSLSDVGDFSDGLARVRKVMTLGEMRPRLSEAMVTDLAERGWKEDSQEVDNRATFKGFIDHAGAFSIPPRFYYATDFSDGLAAVREGAAEAVGFIDKSGAWAIEPTFSYAEGFHNGLALAQRDDKCGYINKSGEWAVDPEHRFCVAAGRSRVAVQTDDTWRVLQHDGTPTTHLDPFSGMNVVNIGEECEGLLPVQVDIDNNYRWGLVDEAGTLVLAPTLHNLALPCLHNGTLLAIVDPPEGAPDTASLPGGHELSWGGYLNTQGTWLYGPVLGPWEPLEQR